MKNTKRMIALLLTALMLLSLAACGQKDAQNIPEGTAAPEEVAVTQAATVQTEAPAETEGA